MHFISDNKSRHSQPSFFHPAQRKHPKFFFKSSSPTIRSGFLFLILLSNGSSSMRGVWTDSTLLIRPTACFGWLSELAILRLWTSTYLAWKAHSKVASLDGEATDSPNAASPDNLHHPGKIFGSNFAAGQGLQRTSTTSHSRCNCHEQTVLTRSIFASLIPSSS